MPLAPDLRRPLNALVHAYEQGRGPVEQEALKRLAAGLPMTALQVTAFAEELYPAEIRTFLDGLGYQALYRRDLDLGLAVGTGGAADLARAKPSATVAAVRPDPGTSGSAIGLRLAVLALALAGSGLILTLALPKMQQAQESPHRRPAQVASATPAPEPQPSVCLQSLRTAATAWCQRALTGEATPGPTPPAQRGSCGDTLSVNGETVRLALDRILADGAAYTYGAAEARERCVAAAKRAAPR